MAIRRHLHAGNPSAAAAPGPAFHLNTSLCVLGFRVLGFRVGGLGFRVLGFRVLGFFLNAIALFLQRQLAQQSVHFV